MLMCLNRLVPEAKQKKRRFYYVTAGNVHKFFCTFYGEIAKNILCAYTWVLFSFHMYT